ncbi:hypothetical protein D0T50_03870 [Bacteroides sp. 214]|uniref:hypothetical protein n=1 Tax=Bacteroides sp. 214 TaxID=2302935 RepID=UPI0013D48B7F|nr:hypothetical protein [Bacteroides sp. 214]NDW12024.1 hypothetical protein [Bacteroides sp. 214]
MTKDKTIFKLIAIEYCIDDNPQYPEFDVHRSTMGYFSSLEKAETQMNSQKHVESRNPTYKYFGFLIEEYRLDNTWILPTESRRSYLPDGSLLMENLLSETPNGDYGFEEFLGHPADKVPIKIGDLVEVLNYNTVRLEIVGNLPPSPEWVRDLHERNSKNGHRISLESSDDCYYTLDESGEHNHPEVTNVFPARFEVSKELRGKLFGEEYHSYWAQYDDLNKR